MISYLTICVHSFYSVLYFSPFTEYEFAVLAMNTVGRGEKSQPVIAKTGETSKILPIFYLRILGVADFGNYTQISDLKLLWLTFIIQSQNPFRYFRLLFFFLWGQTR